MGEGGVSSWWGNWGCCCDSDYPEEEQDNICPCACYSFDETLEDMTGRQKPFEGEVVNYDEGILGHAYSVAPGSTIETPHAKCFTLTGGFSAWVWIYHGNCEGEAGGGGQQVIRKGKGTQTTGEDHGTEWAFYTTTSCTQCNATTPNSVGFGVGNEGGVESSLSGPSIYGQAISAGEYPVSTECFENHWTFYFMYFDPDEGEKGALYLMVDGDKNWSKKLLTKDAVTNTDPVFIGADIDPYSTILVDNLGFCKDIGDEDEMKSRANFLFNEGYGKPCPKWIEDDA